jgi:predicted nucleic acid-binding protein
MTLVAVDTSVWARQRQSDVAAALEEAIEADAVATIGPVVLELLRSARDIAELDELAFEYDCLHRIDVTPSVVQRARGVQRSLALQGYHRGPSIVDLQLSAAAEIEGAVVWHCDRHFDLIAEVTGQRMSRLGQ